MDATLLRVFPERGADAVAKLVDRSYSSVNMRAARLGLHMNRRGKRPGQNALIDRLAAAIAQSGPAGLSTTEFCQRHGDNVLSVRTLAGRLCDEGRAFPAGHQRTRRLFATRDAADEYARTGLPPSFHERLVRERAARIAERKAAKAQRDAAIAAEKAASAALKPPRRRWSDAEIRYLKKHYPAEGAKFVAPVLGRSISCVTERAAKLGIKCLVRVQLIGYVSKAMPRTRAAAPKAAPAPRPPRSKAGTAPRPAPKAVVLRPSAPKPPTPRGPALSDGPVLYHPNFKFTRVPTPPAAFRTNTFSAY